MEQRTDGTELLDLMILPVFCVRDRIIVKQNEAAARLFLREGISVVQLLESGAEDYAEYTGGLLYVTLNLFGQNWGASVIRMGDTDIFTLDQQFDSQELCALALAARELREPLSNAMLAAQQMEASEITSRLNRGLNQLLRIVGNMSDASGSTPPLRKQEQYANALFAEILEKASALTESSGIRIQYVGLPQDVLFPADRQLLERAVLNMLSNAVKFRTERPEITVELRLNGNQLRLSVTDNGCGIPEDIQGTLFRRYLREPGIEDSRHGIGLGMLMIRNAAAAHHGALLVDHPQSGGTRVTMTLSTTPEKASIHSPLYSDYAGLLDHTLLELSDILPADLY